MPVEPDTLYINTLAPAKPDLLISEERTAVTAAIYSIFLDKRIYPWVNENPMNIENIDPEDRLFSYRLWISQSPTLEDHTAESLKVMAGIILGQKTEPEQHYRMSLELAELTRGFRFQDEHGIKFDIVAGSPEIQIFPNTNLYTQDLWIKITSAGNAVWISPFVPYIKESPQPSGIVPALDKLYKVQAQALTSLGSMPVSVIYSGGSFPKVGFSMTWSEWINILTQHHPERKVSDSDHILSDYLHKLREGRGYTQVSLGNGYKSCLSILEMNNLQVATELLTVAKNRLERVFPQVESGAKKVADIFADYVSDRYSLISAFREDMRLISRRITATWPGSLGVYYHKFAQQRVADWVEYHGINIWNTDKEIQHF